MAPRAAIEATTAPVAASPVQKALWRADGVREWHDYHGVRERIEAARAQQQDDKHPEAYPMISFARHRLADVAASIKLPVPPDSPDVTILIPAYNHIVTKLECIASIAAHTAGNAPRSEEHTSELQTLMRISYAVFCLKKKKKIKIKKRTTIKTTYIL